MARRSVATKVDEMDRPEKLRRVVHEMTPVTPSKEMGRWMEDRICFHEFMEFYGICWKCLLISGLQKIRMFHTTFSMFSVG